MRLKMGLPKRPTTYPRKHRGQSMVEFAMAMPFLMLILGAILFFGQYFLVTQVLLYAAQEGAKVASRTPNLTDSSVRDMVRGFSVDGTPTNTNSVIYTSIAAAHLLTNGNSGNLPPGASIMILPWDGSIGTPVPNGTIGVAISYPFSFMGNNFSNGVKTLKIAMSFTGSGVTFKNFNIVQTAIASQEVYQAP